MLTKEELKKEFEGFDVEFSVFKDSYFYLITGKGLGFHLYIDKETGTTVIEVYENGKFSSKYDNVYSLKSAIEQIKVLLRYDYEYN